jgi:hypothetical protein
MLFQWGLAVSKSFWTHDDEILIVPTQSKMEFSCIRAFHDSFLLSLHRVNVGISTFLIPKNENQVWLFSKIYGGISTTWLRSHGVEVNDRGSKSTISKSGITMRSSSSSWDLHTQGEQSWRISSLFQELICYWGTSVKKPLNTLK